MRRPEPQLRLFDLEERPAEFLKRPFQLCHRNVGVQRKPLDLMEHWRVGLIIIEPVDAPRGNYSYRSPSFEHCPDLHR